MSRPDGIVCFRTANRERVVDWYREAADADVWLEQPGCTILERGGFRFGFCDHRGDGDASTGTEGTITFVYPDRAGIDAAHDRVDDDAREDPHVNERYDS
ncbi:hypothetical protein [Halobaculum gomorrense]|uniref:Glyoxalase-like domain-containing protein n=1 Tax=Halobaculum gomorrense TaxID=43928 RepID=A0A1M5MSJ0_9EURY|nr:hypothetical protein [Halobaculum gomorrense]SHG80241.1 hypothetical protein SAMN05443636_1127 [Halobaculum gomorrense]